MEGDVIFSLNDYFLLMERNVVEVKSFIS